ncbi:MAG: ABC transporter permease [Silvanigrellaceae bacterium]|nr:ABC transporter permease [Silvanigrellaceae bacterium]
MELRKHLEIKPKQYPWLSSYGIFLRETLRFLTVPGQTILGPLVSSLIYFCLFGMALGKFIHPSGADAHSSFTYGYSYILFLIPGIMAMEVINASIQNPMSSLMIAKWSRTIVDIQLAPVTPLGTWLAFVGGAIVRSFIIVVCVFTAGCLCAMEIPHNINIILFIASHIIAVGIFSSLGLILGIVCKTWEQAGVVLSFIIQPLVFFSGIFFSFQSFPDWLNTFKYINPIFYIVSMFRASILGIADTQMSLAFGVSLVFLLVSVFWSQIVLRKGLGTKV